jgi:tetratricopeptide (TPR) repeat protein
MTKLRLILSTGLLALVALLALVGCRSAHTTSAILYIEEQRYDKAVNVLHEGLDYNPEEPDAYYWLGEAHSKLAEVAIQDDDYGEAKKNYELSYEYYAKARDLSPEKFTEKSELAMQHNFTLRNNDAKREFLDKFYEQAEGYFRLAYAALPDSLSSIRNLARMKIQMALEKENDPQLYGEALELLDQVLLANPDAYSLLADKASVLAALGRNTEADRIYTELLKDHGDDPALLIDIANLATDEEDYERAANLYIRIIDIYENDEDPDNDDEVKELLVRSGTWLADSDIGRYEEALELFDRALQLELFPSQQTQFEYLRTYYNYGEALSTQAAEETDTLREAELEAQAKAQFTRGVEVGNALVESYPNYAYGYYYIFLCHSALGDDAAAQLNFSKFNELQGQED